ncbi:hypothetical protein [Rhodoferax sp.]|uniref:hypothetical protein n=1 Tax=Rhodoferax sp. TaxID=50421 RepID=UPI00374DD40F
MSDDLNKDYIKAIISVVEEDKKSILLYVAFDLAVVSLTLSDKLLRGATSKSPFIAAGLCLLLSSAGLFFNHYRKVHLSTFEIVDQLLTLDTQRARAISTQTWKKHQFGYRLGYVIRLLGIATLLAMVIAPN